MRVLCSIQSLKPNQVLDQGKRARSRAKCLCEGGTTLGPKVDVRKSRRPMMPLKLFGYRISALGR